MAVHYIYVTGPNGSGKSSLLASLGGSDGLWLDEAASVEYRQFTVDEDLELVLFCAPDATRFDHLLQVRTSDLLGYIVVVDSTDPETWSTAQIMVTNCRGYALLPMIIAANKQDLPGAYTPEQVGGRIGMEAMMRVQGCVATNPESVRNLFLQLLYAINEEIERLDALIEAIEKLSAQSADEA